MPVTIDSITTADAAPAVAPHRISNKATKDVARVAFTPTGAAAVLAYRFTTSAVGPYLGTEVSHKGRVATEEMACSANLVCEDFQSPSGVQLTEDVTYLETGGPADGSLPVNVWVNFGGVWA